MPRCLSAAALLAALLLSSLPAAAQEGAQPEPPKEEQPKAEEKKEQPKAEQPTPQPEPEEKKEEPKPEPKPGEKKEEPKPEEKKGPEPAPKPEEMKQEPKKEEPKAEPKKDQGKIRWTFEEGKPFYQTLTSKTEQQVTVMGLQQAQTQAQTFVFKWEPLQADGPGAKLKMTVEAVKIDIDIAGNPISYDSRNEQSAANTPLADFFKGLVNASFTMTLGEDQQVQKVEGRQEFLDGLTGAGGDELKKQLGGILSEEALKQLAFPTFTVVPPEPKDNKGDTWTRQNTLDLGPIGSYQTELTFVNAGPAEGAGEGVVKVEMTGKLNYQAPKGDKGGLPFEIQSADLKADSYKGTALFDTKAGRMTKADITVRLGGKVKVEVGGMETDVEVKQEQTTTLEVSDKSPAEAKKSEEKKEEKKDAAGQ